MLTILKKSCFFVKRHPLYSSMSYKNISSNHLGSKHYSDEVSINTIKWIKKARCNGLALNYKKWKIEETECNIFNIKLFSTL